jgi:hypothetical protein
MVGFFNLKSGSLVDQRKTGDAIMRLMRRKAFKDDPKAWLYKAGYRYEGPGAGPNGEVPATKTLIPVYDTETTMHVRVPWKGVLDIPEVTQNARNEPSYGATPQVRFPVLLARYFMRQCR